MFRIRRTGLATAGLLIALALAGCTASNPYGSGGSGGASAANTPSTSSGPVVVQTATATVGGSSETILTNGQGRTLYYFDSDSAAQAACTTGCTGTWPPLLASSASSQVQAPSNVSGTFAIVNAGNGTQVEYKGHPLYTYSGDSGPGQTTGDGIEGKWHVATPNIPQNTTGGNNGY